MQNSNQKRHRPDPFAFARITSSQEDLLLNHSTFVADTLTSPCNCNNKNHHHDDIPSSSTAAAAAAEIVSQPSSVPQFFMCSAPDTQHVPQDVSLTPPEEESLLPSSNVVVDVPFCAFNQAVIDVDDESHVFFDFDDECAIDFQKASELGFPDNPRSVVENQVPDEFWDFDREISVFHQPPVKKSKVDHARDVPMEEDIVAEENVETLEVVQNKNAENVEGSKKSIEEEVIESSRMREVPVTSFIENLNLGFDSVNNVVGGEQVNVDVGDVPMEEDIVAEETRVVPNQNAGNVEGSKKSSEEVVTESSRMREDPVMTFMPDSIRCVLEKGAENGRETRKDKGKHKFSVFAILKVLVQTKKEEDDGLTVLETAKRSGMKFPRPCWWPENMKSELFNFDDPVKM